MSDYSGPSWLVFQITHCEDNGGKTFDRYTVDIQYEWRKAGDEGGDSSEYQYFYFGMSHNPTHPQGFSQYGEGWLWKEDDPDTVQWEDLPEHIRKHVVLRCVDDNEDVKPLKIWLEDEDNQEIFPADYGIDIEQYLYREVTSG